MPTPNFPGTFPLTSGDTTDPDLYFTFLYDDASPLRSMSAINGLLVDTDLANSFQPDHVFTQRGSHVDCEGSSGTAAIDYVGAYVFGSYRSTFPPVAKNPYRAIPGASRAFYMPWDGSVLVTWSVFWTARSTSSNHSAYVFAALDGTRITDDYRRTQQVAFDTGTVYNYYAIKGYEKARVWSGHTWIDTTAGWHDFGLYLLCDSRIHSTRVHSANVNLMKFKTGDTL